MDLTALLSHLRIKTPSHKNIEIMSKTKNNGNFPLMGIMQSQELAHNNSADLVSSPTNNMFIADQNL